IGFFSSNDVSKTLLRDSLCQKKRPPSFVVLHLLTVNLASQIISSSNSFSLNCLFEEAKTSGSYLKSCL
ncbi:unnamed protein product, partial [Rotaria magnacalcarata]